MLRHRVRIERSAAPTRTTDGGFTENWTTLATVWARIHPLSGREYLEAQQVEADVSHKIWMRHNFDYTITPRDRITYGSRAFNILSAVNVNEENRMVEVMAKEAV